MRSTCLQIYLKQFIESIEELSQLDFEKGDVRLLDRMPPNQNPMVFFHISCSCRGGGATAIMFSEALFYHIKDRMRELNLIDAQADSPHQFLEQAIQGIHDSVYAMMQSEDADCDMHFHILHYFRQIPQVFSNSQTRFLHIPFHNHAYQFDLYTVNTTEQYFNRRNLLFYGVPEALVRQVVLDFLPLGFIIFHAFTREEVRSILTSHPIDYLIIDENCEASIEQFVRHYRQKGRAPHLSAIIFSTKTNAMGTNFLSSMLIKGILNRFQNVTMFSQQLRAIVSNDLENRADKRQEIRYYPDTSFFAEIEIPIEQRTERIPSHLVNISMHGVTWEQDQNEDALKNTVRHNVPAQLNFQIANRRLNLPIQIREIQGKRLHIAFQDELSPQDSDSLAMYINQALTRQILEGIM
jgi:hypothetical protein